MNTTFDTHASVKKLKDAGFTEEQAEAQVQVLSEIIESNLATKQDLKEVEAALKRDIVEVKRDIAELRLEMKALEERLIGKMYQALLVQTLTLAVLFGALKLFA